MTATSSAIVGQVHIFPAGPVPSSQPCPSCEFSGNRWVAMGEPHHAHQPRRLRGLLSRL